MKKITPSLSRILFLLILVSGHVNTAFAQIPQVPRELQFADLIVRINEQARREIQLDVDALYRNPTYFKVKTERANMFMPLVERELRNAGVPTDLKYLVIQESGLIADAVSTSNAVGYWQFKQGTAEEVFLRVDNQIDERKNIVSSSRGAALYLRKHNASFDNWMCALVSYQMGLGGARSYFGTEYNGKKVVEIDRNSHWYFKKFLAHKVAFEPQLGMMVSNNTHLVEERIQGPTTFKALAPRFGVTEDHLKEYNKWANRGQIPGDRAYSVVYVKEGVQVRPAIENQPAFPQGPLPATASTTAYPKVSGNVQKATQPNQIKVNEIEAVKAANTTSQESFTDQIGIRERRFRRINDLDKNEPVEAGQYYYTKPKKGKAEAEEHVVLPGETLWSISQMYGIKLSSLKAKNRIRKDTDLKAGMILNLQEHRKRNEDIPIVPAAEYNKIRTASSSTNQPTNQPAAQKPEVDRNESRSVQPSQPVANPAPARNTTNTNANQTVHTVAQGETLYSLGRQYQVPVDDIKRWNSLPDNNIKIGQKITIYKP